jgi:hypothetical protein
MDFTPGMGVVPLLMHQLIATCSTSQWWEHFVT